MVALQALRTFARVPETLRPPDLLDCARVSLRAWRERGEVKPYVFGHGRRFKTVKWPTTWYRVLSVLDALSGYPALWHDAAGDHPDRRGLAQPLACLVAYNVAADGRVTPQSVYRGFDQFSFGQNKRPSPFATARVLATLKRYDELAGDARAVDITSLSSSQGGTGTAVAPRARQSTASIGTRRFEYQAPD